MKNLSCHFIFEPEPPGWSMGYAIVRLSLSDIFSKCSQTSLYILGGFLQYLSLNGVGWVYWMLCLSREVLPRSISFIANIQAYSEIKSCLSLLFRALISQCQELSFIKKFIGHLMYIIYPDHILFYMNIDFIIFIWFSFLHTYFQESLEVVHIHYNEVNLVWRY